MAPDGTATIAQSPEDLRAKVNAQVLEGNPTFFRLEARLAASVPCLKWSYKRWGGGYIGAPIGGIAYGASKDRVSCGRG